MTSRPTPSRSCTARSPSILRSGQLYAKRLIDEGALTAEEAERFQEEISDMLRAAQDNVRERLASAEADDGEGKAERDQDPSPPVEPETTGVPFETLVRINETSLTVPEDFTPHDKLWRQLSRRGKDFSPERNIDWGHAEGLAFGRCSWTGSRSASRARTRNAGRSATGTWCSTTSRRAPSSCRLLAGRGYPARGVQLAADGDGRHRLRVRLLGRRRRRTWCSGKPSSATS